MPLVVAASGATVAVTCRLPGVSAGNWITASGASRWSSSIQVQAACPGTVAYGPGPSWTIPVAGEGAPTPTPVANRMLLPAGGRGVPGGTAPPAPGAVTETEHAVPPRRVPPPLRAGQRVDSVLPFGVVAV